jgi:hypothetical protein
MNDISKKELLSSGAGRSMGTTRGGGSERQGVVNLWARLFLPVSGRPRRVAWPDSAPT